MFDKTYVAIDITPTDVRVISVKKDKVRKWGTIPLPQGVLKGGIISDPKTVSVVVNDLFRSMKLRKDHVIGTVTGLPFIYRVINMPAVEKKMADQAIERAARLEMSIKGEDIYLIWQELPKEVKNDGVNYLVVGIPKVAMKPFLETLSGSGIKPYMLDLKPLALARVASSGESMLGSLEQNYIDVLIVSNGMVRVMHGFAIDGANDVAIAVNHFADGLSKAVNSFNRDYPQNPIHSDTPLFLSGELPINNEVLPLLQQATEHPIKIIDSPLATPGEMPVSLFAANIGLILKKIPQGHGEPNKSGYNDVNLNLLSDIYKPVKVKFKWSYAIITLIFMVLAALLWNSYNLRADVISRADSLRPESDSIALQLREAQKVSKEVLAVRKEKSDKLQTLQATLSSIRNERQLIFGLRYDYASRFEMIMGALPEGTELEEISLDNSMTTIAGKAKNALDVLTFTEALEQKGIFSSAWVDTIAPATDSGDVSFTATALEGTS